MRITNANSANSYMRALQSNLQRMDKVNRELTTQSIINKVSDDPYKAIRVMDLKNEKLNEFCNYIKRINIKKFIYYSQFFIYYNKYNH